MQLTHRPSKLLITGRSGSGKTTFALRYLVNRRVPLKFVFDHEGEYALRLKRPAARTQMQLFNQIEHGLVLFDPSEMFAGRLEAGFRFFCDWCFHISTKLPGVKLFECDEVQKLCGPSKCPWELSLVLETGRRYGLDTVMITQQPNLVHNRIRNQTTEVVTFHQVDRNAIQFLEDLGFDGQRIRQLMPGDWMLRNLQTSETRQGNIFTRCKSQ